MLLKDGHRVSVYKGRIRKDKVIAWVNAHTGPFGGRLGALWRKATGAAPEVRIPRPRDRVIPREFAQWVANSLSSGSPHQAAKALAAVGLLAAFVLAFVAFVVYAFVANAGASDASAEAPDAEGGTARCPRQIVWDVVRFSRFHNAGDARGGEMQMEVER